MIDLRQIPENTAISVDICVVGGGAVGMSIAKGLMGSRIKVALMEGGGEEYSDEYQNLHFGTSSGLEYFPVEFDRLRQLGGATNHWGGHCQPLMPIDLERRDGLPFSGWPISYEDIEPFYDGAAKLVEIDPFENFRLEGWDDARERIGGTYPDLSETFIPKLYQMSPPTTFGSRYGKEVSDSDDVSLYLYANIIGFVANDSGQSIEQAVFSSLDGKIVRVNARVFILAAGTIQNARLLLALRDQQGRRVSDSEAVGRYFQEHPAYIDAALFLPSDDHVRAITEFKMERRDLSTGLTPVFLRENGLLNTNIYFRPRPTGGDSPGVRVLQRIKGGQQWEYEELLDVVTDLANVADYTYRRYVTQTQYAGLYDVTVAMEQAPNPDSRVTLTSDKDSLGIPYFDLHWALGEIDTRSIDAILDKLGHDAGEFNLGRLQITLTEENRREKLIGSHHHLGTTRMSDDPKQGVVDKNCLVHGKSNLYVCGGSVFPTSAAASPTYTIVALALRLADHLKAHMGPTR